MARSRRNLPAVPEPERLPWERQKGESAASFANFAQYRDLGPYRSLSKLAAAGGKAIRTLSEQSSKYGWVERAEAYDDDYDRRRREELENERIRIDRTHMGLGAQMVGLALVRMAGREAAVATNGQLQEEVRAINPNELDAGDVVRLGIEGARLQRVAAGMPTDLLRGVTQISTADAQRVVNDIVEIAVKLLPEERQPRFFSELSAYIESGRRL